jgi:site-specific recombinase XerD
MKHKSTRRLDTLIEEYRKHLLDVQGVSPGTVKWHTRQVRQFLEVHGTIKLNRLRPTDLHHYLGDLASRYRPKTLKSTASSLRSFLKFAQLMGLCSSMLSATIPSIGFRCASRPPKFLTGEQLSDLLDSFRPDNPGDLRNRAMVLCMVRLGLRASEVTGLKLEDLDWRKNVLHLTAPKSRRHQILPLDEEVKQSLVNYLSKARPKTQERHVFLSLRPAGFPIGPGAVSRTTARALKRAGIKAPSQGAHLFRHTAAVSLVQQGATVKEIADLLRHRDLNTTIIYAKVNFSLLQKAIQPWPEVKP